jgi:hypothetical protein
VLRQNQQRIAEWLRERAPQLADAYMGAIHLLGDGTIPGRARFICQAGRDLTTRIPELFAESVGRVDLTADLTEISALWAEHRIAETELALVSTQKADLPGGTLPSIGVPTVLVRRISAFIDHHKQASLNHRDRAIKMVEAVAPENIGKREALLPVANQWLDLHRWFQGHAHAGLEQSTVNEDELQTRFATLESQINALIGEFYEPVTTLDEILQDTNS